MNVRCLQGHALPRKSVDVFFITAVDGGHDLSGVKIERADEKSLVELAAELKERAAALKHGEDRQFRRTKALMERLPRPLLRLAIGLAARLTGDLALDVPLLGLGASPFGSAMVTSVGMFGLPMGFAPLAWMYKTPLLVLAGEIVDKPVAVNGRVEVRPVLPITATIDHRYADGWHLGQLLAPFQQYLEAPDIYERVVESTEPSPGEQASRC
jgi:pyruvate dehydrogenase E2 component (dihydrolipoamide acetyltransferase)